MRRESCNDGGERFSVRVCQRSGAKGSRLAGLSLSRSGSLIKSEGQTGGLPPSFSSTLHRPLSPSTATGYSDRSGKEVEERREGRRWREQGADVESLAACGDCKLWLCGQTRDSNRQIRCFRAAIRSLSLACTLRLPDAVTACRRVRVGVCV